jgi:hypothetical protein
MGTWRGTAIALGRGEWERGRERERDREGARKRRRGRGRRGKWAAPRFPRKGKDHGQVYNFFRNRNIRQRNPKKLTQFRILIRPGRRLLPVFVSVDRGYASGQRKQTETAVPFETIPVILMFSHKFKSQLLNSI